MEVGDHSGSDRDRVGKERRDLAEQIAQDKFLFYERAAVTRLRKGLPYTELEEDMRQEVRLHALVASHKFDPTRGARFTTFLTTYLHSKVSDHLSAFYRPMRNPNSVVTLTFEPTTVAPPTFNVELDELKNRLTPDTRALLDAVMEANTPALRRKLGQGRATSALGALVGLPAWTSRKRVPKALEEIREEARRCLCSA